MLSHYFAVSSSYFLNPVFRYDADTLAQAVEEMKKEMARYQVPLSAVTYMESHEIQQTEAA